MARARVSTVSWSTTAASRSRPVASATSSSSRTCSTPSRSCSPGTRPRPPRRRWSPNWSGSRRIPSPITSCNGRRTSSRATTSWAVRRNQQKALQLAHAAVIHDDVTTADGEFDIFMGITATDIQRVANTYFTPQQPAGDHHPAARPDPVGRPPPRCRARRRMTRMMHIDHGGVPGRAGGADSILRALRRPGVPVGGGRAGEGLAGPRARPGLSPRAT